eukprot:scaffold268341_cov35-Prasinocladus_malaysianus.AAC.1
MKQSLALIEGNAQSITTPILAEKGKQKCDGRQVSCHLGGGWLSATQSGLVYACLGGGFIRVSAGFCLSRCWDSAWMI